MKEEKKEKRDGSFIIRVSQEEKETILKKVKEAGYKSTSAFVRDYIARAKPKTKASISPNTLAIQRELMTLSSLVNSNSGKEDLIKQIKTISRLALGVSS